MNPAVSRSWKRATPKRPTDDRRHVAGTSPEPRPAALGKACPFAPSSSLWHFPVLGKSPVFLVFKLSKRRRPGAVMYS